MNLIDIVSLLATLGLGGAVGAVLALANTGRATLDAFDRFKRDFHRSMDAKSDSDSVALRASFSSLETDLGSLTGSFAKLLRALKRK